MNARIDNDGGSGRFGATDTVLLAVVGMSPAVLTETVWALARGEEPTLPSRIVVVTTLAGKKRIESELFRPREEFGGMSAWDALRADLAAAGHDLRGKLRFGVTADDIRVITAVDPASGLSRELEDIRSLEDNAVAADFLLEQTRVVTSNPDLRLVASIAGGRKTMGALLYACLTLAGRDDDRLTHVLVSEPYETLPGFFFPSQPGPPPTARDGTSHPPAAARVQLAEVPFVPIRNLFHRELGRPVGTFSGLVAACRSDVRLRAGEELKIELHVQRGGFRLNGREIRLSEREFHLLLCLAGRAKRGFPPLPSYDEALGALESHADEWREMLAEGRLKAGTPEAPLFQETHDISRTVSELRKKLRVQGDAGPILAEALPERGRFSLDVPAPLIALL